LDKGTTSHRNDVLLQRVARIAPRHLSRFRLLLLLVPRGHGRLQRQCGMLAQLGADNCQNFVNGLQRQDKAQASAAPPMSPGRLNAPDPPAGDGSQKFPEKYSGGSHPRENGRAFERRGDKNLETLIVPAAPTGTVRLPLGIRACRWWCTTRRRCERWRCVPRPRHAGRGPHASGAASACSACPCGRPLPWRAPGLRSSGP